MMSSAIVKVELEVAENKIEVGNFCAANHMSKVDKIRNYFVSTFPSRFVSYIHATDSCTRCLRQ